MKRWAHLRWLGAPVVVVAALWELRQQLQGLPRAQLATAWYAIPPAAFAWSLAATAASFALLAGYEWFASRLVAPGRIPARTALRVGAIAHAVSNTLGFHALTAGVLRYHCYRPLAVGKADVARLMAVVAACLAAGVATTALLALGWSSARVAGLILASGCSALFVWGVSSAMKRAGQASTSPWAHLGLPRIVGLLGAGVLETTAALLALYVLLPSNSGTLTLIQFVPVFIGATLLGLVSHAPGGVGVFEATILAMLPGPAADTLVSLICYRVIYNLAPFGLASAALVMASLQRNAGLVSSTADNDGSNAAGPGTGTRVSRCRSDAGPGGGWPR